MNGVLGHDFALRLYRAGGDKLANEAKFCMIHAPCAGLIVPPVDLQSNTLKKCNKRRGTNLKTKPFFAFFCCIT